MTGVFRKLRSVSRSHLTPSLHRRCWLLEAFRNSWNLQRQALAFHGSLPLLHVAALRLFLPVPAGALQFPAALCILKHCFLPPFEPRSRLWFPLFLSSAVGNEPHFPLVWIRRRVNGSSYPQAAQKYTRRVLPPAYQPLSLCVIYPSQTGCVQNSSIPVRIFGLSRSSVSSSEHGPSKQRERSPYFDKNVKKWYNKAFKKSKKEIRGVRESWSPWT